jgi:putative signal transducing protein
MKRVYSSHNATLVHHFRNLLEAEGIETEVRNAILSSALGELPPAECQAELWVLRGEDVWRAEEILRAPAMSGPDWACPSCGEVLGAQFAQCWNCGSLRISAPAKA